LNNFFKKYTLPEEGHNQWWRYLVGVIVCVIAFIVLSVLFSLFMLDFSSGTSKFKEDIHPVLLFVFSMSPHVCSVLVISIFVKLFHKRTCLSLITTSNHISWNKVFKAFWVFGLLLCFASLGNYLIAPESISYSFNAGKFFPFLLVILIITPLQTTFEELFFRGYFLQWMGKLKSVTVLSIINGLIFMAPHLGNPEMQYSPVILASTYFLMGFFLALITLKSNGLEYALGVHAVNNLFCGIVLNVEESVLQTESLFVNSEPIPIYDLVSMCAVCILFYFFVIKSNSSEFNSSSLSQDVE